MVNSNNLGPEEAMEKMTIMIMATTMDGNLKAKDTTSQEETTIEGRIERKNIEMPKMTLKMNGN